MQQTKKEKKNKQIGAIVSVGFHVMLVLLFFFMVAWRAPDPPLPDIGIELNFGLDAAGSGEKQPTPSTSPANTKSEEESKPNGLNENPKEVIETETPAETPIKEVTEPTELIQKPAKEITTPVTNTQESPEVVEKTTEPVTKEAQKKEKEVVKEEKPKLPPALYPHKKTGAGGKNGDANEAKNANQGDKTNTVGDQGAKDGTIDARSLYGNSGGGGSSLQMSGWMWNFKPDPDYPKSLNQSGKIVFQVIIDDKGNIVRVITKTSTVSPTLEKVYRDEVMKLTFSKTGGTSVAPTSTGTITFVIKAQ